MSPDKPEMVPIILNEFGEALLQYPGSDVEKYPDLNLISSAGIHALCMGWIDAREVSETHHALCCRACNLRVVIPLSVDTLEGLREYRRHELVMQGLWRPEWNYQNEPEKAEAG